MDVSFKYGHSYRLQGDTLVDGIAYSKLFTRHTFETANDPPFPYSESYYTLEQEPYVLIGGLREDSTHKVWYRNFNFEEWWSADWRLIDEAIADSSELLLYDFDLVVGDSIYFYDVDGYRTVSSVEIDVIDRVTMSFYTPSSSEIPEWTQGMGSRYSSLFSRFDHMNQSGPGTDQALLCFSLNGEIIYAGWGQYDCDGLFTSIEETPIGQLAVYPNPTTGALRIDLSSRLSLEVHDGGRAAVEFEVFDALGRNIPKSSIGIRNQGGDFIQLDLESLPPGPYLIQLISNQGVYSTRIIKE